MATEKRYHFDSARRVRWRGSAGDKVSLPRLQVYLPDELHDELKRRGLPAPELLQIALRAELERQDALDETHTDYRVSLGPRATEQGVFNFGVQAATLTTAGDAGFTRARSERQVVDAVIAARAAGASRQKIGRLLGTSPQAAQQPYSSVVDAS